MRVYTQKCFSNGLTCRKVSSLVEAPDEVDEHDRNGCEGKRLRADCLCYFSCKAGSVWSSHLSEPQAP